MIQNIPISRLVLMENNPRTISKEQFNKLLQSLKDDHEFIQRRPVLVNYKDEKMMVYAGNQRVLAAKKLKWKTIACIVDDDLDERIMHKRILLDNQHFGEWDYDILANSFEIDELLASGFTADDLVGITQNIDTETPEEKEKNKKCCPNCGMEI